MAHHLLRGTGLIGGTASFQVGQRVDLVVLLTGPDAVVGDQYDLNVTDGSGASVPIVFDDVDDTAGTPDASGACQVRFSSTAGFGAPGTYKVTVNKTGPIPSPGVFNFDTTVTPAPTPATPPATPPVPTPPATPGTGAPTTAPPGSPIHIHVGAPPATPPAAPSPPAPPAAPTPQAKPWWQQALVAALAIGGVLFLIIVGMRITDIVVTDNVTLTAQGIEKAAKIEAEARKEPWERIIDKALDGDGIPEGATVEISGSYAGPSCTDCSLTISSDGTVTSTGGATPGASSAPASSGSGGAP